MPLRRVKMNVDVVMDIPEFNTPEEVEKFVKTILSKSLNESGPKDLDFPIVIETPVVELEKRVIVVDCLKIVEGFPPGWDKESLIYCAQPYDQTVDQVLNAKYHKLLYTDLMESQFVLRTKKDKE